MQKTIYIAAMMVFIFGCKKIDDRDGTPQKKYNTLDGKAPIVIGHRGASGLRPEHTLESFKLAIDAGADYVEPDLVLTKDSVLICRHEPMLSGTTNVSTLPQFASKKTSKSVDGVIYNDWFAGDFTLSEIKQLKAIQAFSERGTEFNNLFQIPTFEEMILLVKNEALIKGKVIGIYPETKHPTFHTIAKLPINDKLLEALTKANWNSSASPVIVQSFEVANLQYIRSKSSVKIVQLFDAYDLNADGTLIMTAPNGQPFDFVVKGDARTYNDLATDEGLEFIKQYANGIGVWKPFVQPYTFTDTNKDNAADDINGDGSINDADFSKLPPTTLISRAHKKNLVVHAYTFRNESRRLLSDYKSNPELEYIHFYNLGIDGVFSDFPATAVKAKN